MDKIEKYIRKVKERYPNINVISYQKNDIGQKNNIIIINNEYVFKSPKYVHEMKILGMFALVIQLLISHH